jgi:hypothetical protein
MSDIKPGLYELASARFGIDVDGARASTPCIVCQISTGTLGLSPHAVDVLARALKAAEDIWVAGMKEEGDTPAPDSEAA